MRKAAKAEQASEPAPEAADEEEEAPPALGAEVAYAKSGRSLCKECRLPIAMGALRIGGATPPCLERRARALTRLRAPLHAADFVMDYGPAEGKVLTSWRHPECFSLPENECRTVEDLRGARARAADARAVGC